MDSNQINVLYVDDEKDNLVSFKAAFRRDFNIFTASSASEGLEVLKQEEIHIIVTDQRMPEMTGVQFLEIALKEFPEPIRILLTGYSDIGDVVEAINKGQIYKYLTKPWDEEAIRIAIRNAYEVLRLRRENRELLEKYRVITLTYGEVMKKLSEAVKN